MAERARAARKRGDRKGRSKANGGGGPAQGHNSGTIPAELRQRHYDQIGVALRAYEKAADEAKRKKSTLSNCYKAAKQDGLSPDALRETRKIVDGDRVAITMHYVEIAETLAVVQPELDLFSKIERPAMVNAYLAGQQAGREGAPAGDNPHVPGSGDFVTWAEGHVSGVDKAREGLRTGQPLQ